MTNPITKTKKPKQTNAMRERERENDKMLGI